MREDQWIEQLLTCQFLPEADMRILCDKVRNILMEESNVQPVSSPVTICGDIHGQFWDLLELLRKGGMVPETSYIFMASVMESQHHQLDDRWASVRETSSIGGTTALRLFLFFLLSRQGRLQRIYVRASSLAYFPWRRYPDRVTLLRGNHESRQITQVYGFYGETHIEISERRT